MALPLEYNFSTFCESLFPGQFVIFFVISLPSWLKKKISDTNILFQKYFNGFFINFNDDVRLANHKL